MTYTYSYVFQHWGGILSESLYKMYISQYANRFSSNFTYFVKPYGSTGLIKVCLHVFVVVNNFCLFSICKFYVIHTAHILTIDLPSNTCTLCYTIYAIHQLLYVSHEMPFSGCHSNKAMRCHSQAVTLTKLYKPHSPVFCCQVSAIMWFKWRMHCWLFGTFAKLFKKKKSFVMSICLSVYLSIRMEQYGSQWTHFHETWYLRIFQKSVQKIQVSLKHDNI